MPVLRRRPGSRLRTAVTIGALAAAVTAVAVSPAVGARRGGAAPVAPARRAAAPAPADTQVQVLRVGAPDAAALRRLSATVDLLEARDGEDYFVLGDAGVAAALRAQGLRVSVERALPPLPAPQAGQNTLSAVTAKAYPTFYGGYHTVAAHLQHLSDVAAAYPALTQVVDYGDSWRKTRRLSGYDLKAICITKKKAGDCARRPTAAKPRSVVMAGIHARELAPPEIAWNWIEYLTSSYGRVPAVTALLNSTEIWVLPMQNPDGRKIVESGGTRPYLQRKNANNSRGGCPKTPTATTQLGVDLNRNGTFRWGGVGSSPSACSQTYRGPSAGSEPETKAVQALFGQLFRDRRGPKNTDAAPATTTGTMMTYHSYAGVILYPWGDVNTPAPNAAKLKALADRMAVHNGYRTGQPGRVLYNVTGTTDDELYGRLGVAAFTTELGASGTSCDGFTPSYSCVGSRFWPQERQALMVLGQAAARPYR